MPRQIYTASADQTLGIWDVETGERVRKWKGHSLVVNSCSVSRNVPELVVSGSDDGCVKIWDAREKNAVETFQDDFQVTAACFSDSGDMVFTGGIDNEIKVGAIYMAGLSQLDCVSHSNFTRHGIFVRKPLHILFPDTQTPLLV